MRFGKAVAIGVVSGTIYRVDDKCGPNRYMYDLSGS